MKIKKREEAAAAAGISASSALNGIAGKTDELLDATSSLSGFDVRLSYVNDRLNAYTGEMKDISQANLAVIEETTASMNQVDHTVGDAAKLLETVTDSAYRLSERNEQSKEMLDEAVSLKNDVMEDSREMRDKIAHLTDLTVEIERVVASVQEIAAQTNLLALNASIEAARAGEQGKGFAVVADEVRKLADDTKVNLESMRSFVEQVKTAAAESKSSLARALQSTDAMGEKIEQVHATVSGNASLLKDLAQEVKQVNTDIQAITISTGEINKAMEQNSEDAQRLTEVAMKIAEGTEKNTECAVAVGDIDATLSNLAKDLFLHLREGGRTVTAPEFAEVLRKAKQAHKTWTETLCDMTRRMETAPLQTNGERCAFGHFYHALQIRNGSLLKLWQEIGEEHRRFHAIGGDVMAAIKRNDRKKADELYKKAEGMSAALLQKLDQAENIANQMAQRGESVN